MRRRRLFPTLLLTSTLAAATALAAPDAHAAPTPKGKISGTGGNFGLGFSLGDVMGASMKLFVHPNHALQWDLGWMPLHFGAGGLTMSYLWHPGTFVDNSVMAFLGYVGVGIGIAGRSRRGCCRHRGHDDRGDGYVGMILRIPTLGLAFHWKKVPLDTAIEGGWSPYIVAGPPGHAGGYLLAAGDVAVKVRYYF